MTITTVDIVSKYNKLKEIERDLYAQLVETEESEQRFMDSGLITAGRRANYLRFRYNQALKELDDFRNEEFISIPKEESGQHG